MNVVLFGTIFMDIKGFSANHYDPVGRNVGEIKFIHGGVGRNVAENLGVLGIPVTFASTLDAGGAGEDIASRLRQNMVRTEYLIPVESGGIGMWMAILDHQGDLAGSISKMPEFDFFEKMVDEKAAEIIARASHVVVEIDLTEAITRKVMKLAKQYNKPVYGIPGNLEVIKRNKDLLADMACFICNDIEAQKLFLTYLDPEDLPSFQSDLKKFAEEMQIQSIVVTMGERGAVFFDRGTVGYVPVVPVAKMVDSTGAGDAFFSGTVAALVKGMTLAEAVGHGAQVAAFTIQSPESTCIGFKYK